MSAIKKINDNELRRDVVSSDRTTVYTDGYENLFTDTTPVTIADIIAGYVLPGSVPGQVQLSNVYVPGKSNLMINLNGLDLLEPGVDYTEINNRVFQLSAFQLGVLAAFPITSKLRIKWNRPLPGARDQELNNLKDVTPDLSDAVLDPGTLRPVPADAANVFAAVTENEADALKDTGVIRASPATAANPLATIADATAAASAVTLGAILSLQSSLLAAPLVLAIPVGTRRIEVSSMQAVAATSVAKGEAILDTVGGVVHGLSGDGLGAVVPIAGTAVPGGLPVQLVANAAGGAPVVITAYTAPTGVPGSITFTGDALGGVTVWMFS